MHTLRTSSLWVRLVLAWFLATLGVATASPVVHAHAYQMVCADGAGAGVMKLVLVDDEGQAVDAGHHTLDCPMCLPAMLPPAPLVLSFERPEPLAHALQPRVAAHLAATVGAPLPPRGPPAARA